MTTIAHPAEPRVVLDGVSWESYQRLLREMENRNLRLTYDDGRLEIMSPLPIHESVKTIVARLIEAYADEMEIDVEGFGSTTFSRQDLRKGIEPDECYYIQHAADVAGRHEFDWQTDPPPDLAIEVDISSSHVPRQPIYAALGVPEIWRYDGHALTPLHRTQSDRPHQSRYVEAQGSLAFPNLPMEQINQCLQLGLTRGQSAAVRALRQWMQE